MHLTRRTLAAGVALLAACAGGQAPQAPAPADLSALEAASQQRPRDAGLMTQLGIGYYEAKNFERAHAVLSSALILNRQNFPAHVYLGLTFEELGRYDSARVAYTTASAQARNAGQRSEIENRLTLLTRAELRAAAREAIGREQALSAQPPTANAVAVFPFRYVGSNPEYAPLGRGLTHLMITDLSKLSRLTLLERERVQALVEELALNETGRVDPGTGARSGRLLRAGRVIQGSVGEAPGSTNLRLDAAVVDATSSSVVATGTGSDQLQQLFQLEKTVLFRLLDQMGMVLTPSERRAISERPTADMQAFLAFSGGLEAEDRGDYAAAEASYAAAVARDPNFAQARARRANSARAAQAQQVTPRVLAGLLPGTGFGGEETADAGRDQSPGTTGRGPILRTGIQVTTPSVGTTLTTRVGSNGPVSQAPTTRPTLPETLSSDNPSTPGGLLGTIIIIITRP